MCLGMNGVIQRGYRVHHARDVVSRSNFMYRLRYRGPAIRILRQPLQVTGAHSGVPWIADVAGDPIHDQLIGGAYARGNYR